MVVQQILSRIKINQKQPNYFQVIKVKIKTNNLTKDFNYQSELLSWQNDIKMSLRSHYLVISSFKVLINDYIHFNYELTGNNLQCRQPIIRIYCQYLNHQLYEYLSVIRKKRLPLKVSQIIYILKAISMAMLGLEKMEIQINASDINIMGIYVSNEGEIKLNPMQLLTKREKQQEKYEEICQIKQQINSNNTLLTMTGLSSPVPEGKNTVNNILRIKQSHSYIEKKSNGQQTNIASTTDFDAASYKLSQYKEILNNLLMELSGYTLSNTDSKKDCQSLSLILQKSHSLDEIVRKLVSCCVKGTVDGLLVERIYDMDESNKIEEKETGSIVKIVDFNDQDKKYTQAIKYVHSNQAQGNNINYQPFNQIINPYHNISVIPNSPPIPITNLNAINNSFTYVPSTSIQPSSSNSFKSQQKLINRSLSVSENSNHKISIPSTIPTTIPTSYLKVSENKPRISVNINSNSQSKDRNLLSHGNLMQNVTQNDFGDHANNVKSYQNIHTTNDLQAKPIKLSQFNPNFNLNNFTLNNINKKINQPYERHLATKNTESNQNNQQHISFIVNTDNNENLNMCAVFQHNNNFNKNHSRRRNYSGYTERDKSAQVVEKIQYKKVENFINSKLTNQDYQINMKNINSTNQPMYKYSTTTATKQFIIPNQKHLITEFAQPNNPSKKIHPSISPINSLKQIEQYQTYTRKLTNLNSQNISLALNNNNKNSENNQNYLVKQQKQYPFHHQDQGHQKFK